MDQATKDAFATLTKTVERGFSAVTEDMTALKAELKSDIASIGDQVAGIERDIRELRRDLSDLAEKVDNIAGYRKEIDHAFERIAAIEKHLGISRKIAA
jgi:archaellum component FlaC